MTQGRGLHRAWFNSYESMPRHVQDSLVAEVEATEEG